MEVKQIYNLVNTAVKETLGESVIVKEDLTNLVDVGEAVFNANKFENYVGVLTDHIGKMVFDARIYKGNYPSIMVDAWEYGSVVEKVRCDMPDVSENESWELEDGNVYETNEFTAPKNVSVKFYNSKTTFEVKISVTEIQLKSAFSNITQMNSFLSMIYTKIENKLRISYDELILRVINSMTGETLYDLDNGGTYSGKTGVRAINLLYKYNTQFGTSLTRDTAIVDPDFLRYASIEVRKTLKRMARASRLFNIGGTEKFTPREYMHLILHADFADNASGYLYSNTWHEEKVELPNYEEVVAWQGSGSTFAFGDTSKIDIKTPFGHDVTATGIIGVAFDKDALGVSNVDKRVKTHYVASAEFLNEWHKSDATYWVDSNENFVVFYLA